MDMVVLAVSLNALDRAILVELDHEPGEAGKRSDYQATVVVLSQTVWRGGGYDVIQAAIGSGTQG